jgi:hypothetical protein
MEIRSGGARLKARDCHEMDSSAEKRRFGVLVLASVLISANSAVLVEQATAQPTMRSFMPKYSRLASDAAEFASKEEAEAFLAKTLPIATASNPKYRGDAGALTQWLTKELTFGPTKNPNGISVHMSEAVLNFRNGALVSTGSHEVQFQIEDVSVSVLKDSPDLTEAGEQGQGVIFHCATGKCVAHKWDGVESSSDWTDISIQDLALRDKILAAFMTLKRAAGGQSPT